MNHCVDDDRVCILRSVKQWLVILRFLAVASRECAWMALKNLIKILIGRRPYYDGGGLFLWQYFLHLTGFRPIRKITCVGQRGEGPGSQALMIMKAVNFAFSSGLTYVHTPFTHIRHADRPMEEWAAAWEALLNLGAGEIVCEAERRDAVIYCHNLTSIELCLGWSRRRNELRQNFKVMIPRFRRKYYLDKSPRTTKEVTVAVHIRRGSMCPPPIISGQARTNSTDYRCSKGRFLTLTVSGTESASIRRVTGLTLLICVFLEWSYRNIGLATIRTVGEMILGRSVAPVLNHSSILDASYALMQELVEADVLIMSKSSFCYCAALISDGIKIF